MAVEGKKDAAVSTSPIGLMVEVGFLFMNYKSAF